MSEKRRLEMSISLNALEHLGMNLYSNVPSVLSEIVANAWDADATKVVIDLDRSAGKITIDDDGMGMSRDEPLISARSCQPPSIQSKSRSRACLSCVFVRSTRSPFGYIANGYSI